MSAQLFESSPVEPLVVGVHLYPGDTWFREVHVRSMTTQAPVDLSAWVFEARLAEHVGVVDASRSGEGRLAMTFTPEQTADAEWGDEVTLSGTLAGGRRTFLHGSVGAAVGSSIPVGPSQKTRVVQSDVDISVYAAPRGDKGEDGSAVSMVLVQRAEAAEGRAVSAADVASSAAGSAIGAASAAGDAAGDAGEAAGVAVLASQGIVAARDAAATSAGKANTDADRAGTSAFSAAGSAAAAQGSENAAGTARTGAETARTGAEAARTGAETAKTAAEAARDAAQTTNFGGTTPAANTSLDTLTNPGVYRITWGAAVAQGAPYENFVGTFETLPRASNAVTQIAIKHNALSSDARRFYMRTQTGGGWGAWAVFASPRVDLTAGRAIYLWDDTAGRDQLIFGDTGRRDITSLFGASVTAGRVLISRYGRHVTVTLDNVTVPSGAPTVAGLIPVGFRTTSAAVYPVGYSPNTATVWGNGDINLPTGSGRYGSFTYLTEQAWPTSLPGTADGSVPSA
ncbi:hypothetical protein J2X55_002405 [Microbacterium sp. 1154]|uniref:pyocin knob domain-containing protein n=1 Tax=Microbacterium sp. 1154 TaxID=2817733 RepID=UPI00285A4625|nr:pyocin knob domain-containing protein [Microbacterium sp. 1154]MDR6691482.1 hypothetical protein [Microbacterium sp. 1154]